LITKRRNGDVTDVLSFRNGEEGRFAESPRGIDAFAAFR